MFVLVNSKSVYVNKDHILSYNANSRKQPVHQTDSFSTSYYDNILVAYEDN